MKIIHICMCDAYVENLGYHRNLLPKYNRIDGNEVTILTNSYTMEKNGRMKKIESGDCINEIGIKLIRLKDKFFLPKFIQEKIRIFKDFYKKLEEEKPDIIMVHNAQFYNLLDVIKYKKKYPRVKLYMDNHADKHNSGRNILSILFLQKLYYRFIIQNAINYVEKYFYISLEAKKFMQEMYNIPEEKLELYYQGAEIIEFYQKMKIRKKIRNQIGISEEEIIFIHSGKMNESKKTLELLKAFNKLKNKDFYLILIGNIDKKIEIPVFEEIEKNKNIKYLGWKNRNELKEFLCSADLYLQPGTQSVTMQEALCCGTPVMIYPYESLEICKNGSAFYVTDLKDIYNTFKKIETNKMILLKMSNLAYKLSLEIWDYRKLAKRILR